MEIEKFNIEKEFEDIIEKVKEKYNYKEDLCRVLKRILPAMLVGKSFEERELFYKMILETPIVVLPRGSNIDEISNKMFEGINPHIIDEEISDMYTQIQPAGRFRTETILNENLEIIGRKQAIFIQTLDGVSDLTEKEKERIELYGSGIEISHLIHELGHAWASTTNIYKKETDGSIKERVGFGQIQQKFKKTADGRIIRSQDFGGRMIEECMNTEMEESALKKVLGIDDKKLEELYKQEVLVKSSYQILAAPVMKAILKRGLKKEFEQYRFFGDERKLEMLDTILRKLPIYNQRTNSSYTDRKKNFIEMIELGDTKLYDGSIQHIDNPKVLEERIKFIDLGREDFYGDKTNLTPVQYLDSLLNQIFHTTTYGKKAITLFDRVLNPTEYTEFSGIITEEARQFVSEFEGVKQIENNEAKRE